MHGTGSSVVRWAEMYNRLLADPEIRRRYQFWFFQYDSGNPIALSSLHLRESLAGAIARLDPQGKDPALRRMVLVGHSQGGLLVKMQVISSGDRLWNAASRKPFAEWTLRDETRDLLQRGLFVEPSPSVSRVVFISTPHRGSFVAGRQIIANLVRRLLTLPAAFTGVEADIARNRDALTTSGIFVPRQSTTCHLVTTSSRRCRTSRWRRPSRPTRSFRWRATGRSRAATTAWCSTRARTFDGVESELVVRSEHSTQGRPETIEEVRRILRRHADVK